MWPLGRKFDMIALQGRFLSLEGVKGLSVATNNSFCLQYKQWEIDSVEQTVHLVTSAKLGQHLVFQTGIIIIPRQAAALVHIYTDGSVLVAHGGCEIGQGLHTKMIQVR